MLSSLSIKNYALIENLKVNFQDKLSIITGETGAGKSILLGGLALVLGKRADASLVYNKEKKCVIEAEFSVANYNLKPFFDKEDLDYELITTIRREILPNGKSRAFINDTPTTLPVLTTLSEQLIDIHSQHEVLQLADNKFQFKIIDAFAENEIDLNAYSDNLERFKKLNNELAQIILIQKKTKEELDYNTFILNELQQADLKEKEQFYLENTLKKLAHVEEIKSNLSEFIYISEDEEIGVKNQLNLLINKIERISGYSDSYQNLTNRLTSLIIELNDIVQEVESENENLDYDPLELDRLNDRLQVIYALQNKHSVSSITELLKIQEIYADKVNEVENVKDKIAIKTDEIENIKITLDNLALKIHNKRTWAIPIFIKQLESILSQLKMKNTKISIDLISGNDFLNNGKDSLEFMISSDKGLTFESLRKIASGGEMSRIMLAVKSILSKYTDLPAIIFDEIDTGVSGEVSNKIAEVMQQMSKNMQVITITHLPQIAASGNQHYKVFKSESDNEIHSNIKLLSEGERIHELAEMLGGKNITNSAIAHAKQLLN
jgi:DNA repair protein RecN (Recombination protein N)